MKTTITVIVLSTVLTLLVTGARPRSGWGGTNEQSVLEETSPPAAATEQPENIQEETTQPDPQVEAELALAQAQVKKADEQAAQAGAVEDGSGAVLGDLPSVSGLTRLHNWYQQGRGGGKGLVIRSSETDPKDQAALEEDLSVMSHILSKAVEEKVGSQSHSRRAMGIDLVFASSSSPLHSLYLDGYGALFLLRVNFPLIAPVKREAAKEQTETSSTWEEARQELYGQRGEGRVLSGSSQEYDEEKVTNLKDALLEALKNATHIRELKPDDAVTVCIFGGGPARVQPVIKRGPTAGVSENSVWVFDTKAGPKRGTIMTMRIKKSDADAYAKNRVDLEEFRKRAKITSYIGNAETGGAAATAYGFGNGFTFETGR